MPATAEWSDMPESAIKTGHIDFILSAEDIAQKIVEIAHAFPGQEWGRRAGEDE
jgi:two-component system chemotaxis response regulator CheB